MYDNFKKSSVLLIISIYVFGVILAISGDFLQQLQTIRHQNQIKKIKNAVTFSFSEKQWYAFSDQYEIKQNNHFYDVISIQKSHSNIVVKAVKDDFENDYRVAFNQLINKNKLPISEKKKANFFSSHYVLEYKFVHPKNSFLLNEIQKYESVFLTSKTASYVYLQDKPPC